MKTEQEIVLQKKTIIIFSLLILILAMGILNVQKTTVLAAAKQEKITKVYTTYIANADLFKIEVSGEVVSGDGRIGITTAESGEAIVPNEKASGDAHMELVSNEEVTVVQEDMVSPDTAQELEAEPIKVASRGSYVRDTNVPPAEYEKVITVKATAYCLCQKCCGKSPSHPAYGYTASGLRIIPGTGMKVIAVDPNFVKLGSEVYVEGLNGAPSYGYAIAADTGGAIKNNKIDLYMDTHQMALQWGVRYVNLYVLKGE